MRTPPSPTEQLIAWIDDAHAMESGLIPILQTHAGHFADAPLTAERLRQHALETQQHAQRLQECLRLLDAAASDVKSTVSSWVGSFEGGTTALFRDQLVKDALADYASEQFEVACYTALVAAATQMGYVEVARLCRQNLEEDEAMAAWLLRHIPSVVSSQIHGPAAARARG